MKGLKKLTLALFLFAIISGGLLSAQELSEEKNTGQVTQEVPKSFFDSLSFIIKMPATVYLNMADKSASAPSPILFTPGFGFIWPNDTFISFEPSANFFFSYFLWYDGRALPAEIENRTASTLSVLLDLPVVFALNLEHAKLQLNAGASILMRFGWLSQGNDESLKDEVELINDYFWSKARFLYLSGGASWIFSLPSNTQFGPFLNIYAPIGSIFAREGLNGMIISVGLKISFSR